MLRTADLDFALPPELLATTPAEPRDSARLMVVSRTNPGFLEHGHIRDLPGYLAAGDLLVVNSTRVIPARFEGKRLGTGGRLPGLYLGPVANAPSDPSLTRRWLVLIKGGHLHPGVLVSIGDGVIRFELLERSTAEAGAWVARVHGAPPAENDQLVLERIGMTPLPPYILQARRAREEAISDQFDRGRYQTVYAAEDALPGGGPGSVAAPTAGLHLTPQLLSLLEARGVTRAQVTLHVGTGTFKPVETEFLEQHPMHAERCSVSPATRAGIAAARASKGRVFCVGTTAARAVETYALLAETGDALPEWVDTRILITPGYKWHWVDGLLTNFHLPQSTLLAMVASLFDASGGLPRLREIYRVGIAERYRFFSYGDAMLILP